MSKIKGQISPILPRIKAFLIDMFMIAIPELYIVTYVILGGKDEFLKSHLSIFLIWLIYGIIISLFQSKTAQSPGYRAMDIYLINLKTGKKPSFLDCFFRYVLFIVFGPFGLLFCLFRKDRLNLHDITTKTAPLIKKDQ